MGANVIVNEELAQNLHKPVIISFYKRKVYTRLTDDIWGADLSEIASFSFKNEPVKYFLCVVVILTKYAWVKPLKNKKSEIVLNGFIEIVNKYKCQPNKSWLDQARYFYNSPMQKWLDDILRYSTRNEGNSVAPERFIKTLKGKIYTK